jgi:tRNA pseudouridine38-40 synthase
MNFYRACLSYKGSAYQGWQKQGHSHQTIQGQLELALKQVSKSPEIKTIGSGRTDSGVHALEQWVSIEMPLVIEAAALQRALNSLLPKDIIVNHVSECNEKFHPVFSAIKKEYRYYFAPAHEISPFSRELVTGISEKIDLDQMNQLAKLFIGKHDFEVFSTKGTDVAHTVREIYECEVIKTQLQLPALTLSDIYCFRVVGEGFLKQMVRLMVAAVWRASEDPSMSQKIQRALSKVDMAKPGITAPPQGLYLYKVFY